MSVEGMWAIYFGHVQMPNNVAGSGILVLETGKLFGGDSYIAYHGSYEASGSTISGEGRTWTYGPFPAETVFGKSGPIDEIVALQGKILTSEAGEMTIEAQLWTKESPDQKINAFMRKIAELP